jgi:hypothetical protein
MHIRCAVVFGSSNNFAMLPCEPSTLPPCARRRCRISAMAPVGLPATALPVLRHALNIVRAGLWRGAGGRRGRFRVSIFGLCERLHHNEARRSRKLEKHNGEEVVPSCHSGRAALDALYSENGSSICCVECGAAEYRN